MARCKSIDHNPWLLPVVLSEQIQPDTFEFALDHLVVGTYPVRVDGQQAEVQIGTGRLRISWALLPERRIALLVMQRLCVRFAFEGLSEQQRYAFMRPFDLTIQRGGG